MVTFKKQQQRGSSFCCMGIVSLHQKCQGQTFLILVSSAYGRIKAFEIEL